MKVGVVLVLAVFTGCYADEPNPELELLSDAFWSYVSKATQASDETIKMIRESQLGQEVNARLIRELLAVRDQLGSYAENLKSQVQQRVEELRAAMAPYADLLRP